MRYRFLPLLVLLTVGLVGCSQPTRKLSIVQGVDAELTYTTNGNTDNRGLVTNKQAGQVVWVEFGEAEALTITQGGKEVASFAADELGLSSEGSSAVVAAYPREAPFVLVDLRGLYETGGSAETENPPITVVHDFRKGGSFSLDPSHQVQSPMYPVPKQIFRPEDEQGRPYYRIVKVPMDLEEGQLQEHIRSEIASKME